MCYIRGNALDYDSWSNIPGLEDWSYPDCLPYFRKSESRDIGPDAYHGGDGPVCVTTPRADNNILFNAMVEARRPGRLPTQRRPQRLPAGRLRPDVAHRDPRRPSLEHRRAAISARRVRAGP